MAHSAREPYGPFCTLSDSAPMTCGRVYPPAQSFHAVLHGVSHGMMCIAPLVRCIVAVLGCFQVCTHRHEVYIVV